MVSNFATLQVSEITKSFGRKQVLSDISLEIYPGEIVGFIGPNGSGKTTTLKSIIGLTKLESGEIHISGQRFTEASKKFIGYLPEERGLLQKETLRHQALFFGQLKGLSKSETTEKLEWLCNRLELTGKEDLLVSSLSLGNQQRVQWVIALIHSPILLVLDEPFNGLDPHSLKLITNILHELVDKGTAIIFSSHQLLYIQEICTRIVMISEGRIVEDSGISDITNSETRKVRLEFKERLNTGTWQFESPNISRFQHDGSVIEIEFLQVPNKVQIQELLQYALEVGEISNFHRSQVSLLDFYENATNA